MPTLALVEHETPLDTIHLFRRACQRRNLKFQRIKAPRFEYLESNRLQPGDLLYRPAISDISTRVEQFLYREGVATLYTHPEMMFYACLTQPLLFERGGLPIPKTICCGTFNRERVESYVEQVGGFPLIMKFLGYEGGAGVFLIHSFESLFPLLEFGIQREEDVLLCQFIRDAQHWRIVVVGDKAIAAHRSPRLENDIRSGSGEDPADYLRDVPPALADIAVRSTQLLGMELGGVDILVDSDDRHFILENNFPCYFANFDTTANIDVAGSIVEHLMRKVCDP